MCWFLRMFTTTIKGEERPLVGHGFKSIMRLWKLSNCGNCAILLEHLTWVLMRAVAWLGGVGRGAQKSEEIVRLHEGDNKQTRGKQDACLALFILEFIWCKTVFKKDECLSWNKALSTPFLKGAAVSQVKKKYVVKMQLGQACLLICFDCNNQITSFWMLCIKYIESPLQSYSRG